MMTIITIGAIVVGLIAAVWYVHMIAVQYSDALANDNEPK